MTRNEARRKRSVEAEAVIAPGRTVASLRRWIKLYADSAAAADALAKSTRNLYQYETTAGGRRNVSREANRWAFDAETDRICGRICHAVLKEKTR